MGKGDKRPKRAKTRTEERIDKTPSATVLAHQLENAQHELNTLVARLKAYQVRLRIASGTEHRPHRGDPRAGDQEVLERLAGALQLAHLASEAVTGTPMHERASTGSDFDRPLPGSSTHLARARARELRNAVHEALDAFDWSSENDWRRKPRDESGIPMVRCRTRECPARDVNVKAWRVIRGGRTIYHQVCSSCGAPYPPAMEVAS